MGIIKMSIYLLLVNWLLILDILQGGSQFSVPSDDIAEEIVRIHLNLKYIFQIVHLVKGNVIKNDGTRRFLNKYSQTTPVLY